MKYAALLVMLATAAAAIPVVDQQSPYGIDTISVGGDPNRVVAQTVTAGTTGDLMRIELMIGCDSGELILEIVRRSPGGTVPGTVVRSSIAVDAAAIPNPPAVRTFELDRWPSMSGGDTFAFVLRNDTGVCTVVRGVDDLDGSTYPDGDGWFKRAGATGWLQFLDFGKSGDLGFKTIVNAPASSPPCVVIGSATPFPGFLPVCRCIADEGLRDFRCALMHPSYFGFRNVPLPIRAGDKFRMKWTLVLSAPMEGVVEVTDHLPPGFGAPKGPLTFYVGQVPVGESLTLDYEAVAPAKPGRYRIETTIGGEKMQTVLEVLPR